LSFCVFLISGYRLTDTQALKSIAHFALRRAYGKIPLASCSPLEVLLRELSNYLAYKFFQHFVFFNMPICIGFLDGDVEGGYVLV